MPGDPNRRAAYRDCIERLCREGQLTEAEADEARRLLDRGRYGELEGTLRLRALVDRDHDAGPTGREALLVLFALVALVALVYLAAGVVP